MKLCMVSADHIAHAADSSRDGLVDVVSLSLPRTVRGLLWQLRQLTWPFFVVANLHQLNTTACAFYTNNTLMQMHDQPVDSDAKKIVCSLIESSGSYGKCSMAYRLIITSWYNQR